MWVESWKWYIACDSLFLTEGGGKQEVLCSNNNIQRAMLPVFAMSYLCMTYKKWIFISEVEVEWYVFTSWTSKPPMIKHWKSLSIDIVWHQSYFRRFLPYFLLETFPVAHAIVYPTPLSTLESNHLLSYDGGMWRSCSSVEMQKMVNFCEFLNLRNVVTVPWKYCPLVITLTALWAYVNYKSDVIAHVFCTCRLCPQAYVSVTILCLLTFIHPLHIHLHCRRQLRQHKQVQKEVHA